MSIFKSFQRIISLAIGLCIMMSATTTSEAVGFSHKHTSACYSIVQTECSSRHSEKVVPEQGTQHCTNCLVMRPVTTYVKWDVCSSTGLQREKGGYHICNTCGARLNEWSVGVGKHIVDAQKLTCGKTNATYGELSLEPSTIQWTKLPYPIIATFTDSSNTIALSLRPYSWDEGKTWVTENELAVNQNGVYTVILREYGGETIRESIEVKNFDFDAPDINNLKLSTEEWTNETITLSCEAQDLQPDGSKGCGLPQYAYCINEGDWQENGEFRISQNGSYKIKVKDQLDNIREVMYAVHNIDITPPNIISSEVQDKGWQKEDVIIKVDADDGTGCGLHEQAYSIGEEWQTENVFTVSENGDYEIKVRDALEQTSMAYIRVSNIDKEIPVVESLEADKEQLYEEKVYVIVKAYDVGESGLDDNAFSVDGGENWSAESSFWVEKGKEYKVVVRDAAGNCSDVKNVCRDDFEYPPKEEPPKEEPSQDNLPKEETPQEDSTKDNIPKEEPVKEEVPKEDIPKDTLPKADKSQEKLPEQSKVEKVVADEYTNESVSLQIEKVEKKLPDKLSQSEMTETKTVDRKQGNLNGIQKVVVAVGSILGSILIACVIFAIVRNMAVILCYDGDSKYERLGRCFIRRKESVHMCTLSEGMIESAQSCQYRILLPKWFVAKYKREDFYVYSKNKKEKLRIEESMDFTL